MKKLLYICLFALSMSNAMAETIVVIDDNGIVRQQMTTSGAATYVSPTVVQPVVNIPQPLTVVRQTPQVVNSYYYDTHSTGSAFAAGITTAVVGALLFDGFRVHRHHKRHRSPAIIRHNHGHPGMHIRHKKR